MKKLLTLAFFLCTVFFANAQTDGITYQAVIIDPENLELPGVDSEGNYLPNTTIAIRFTIYDSGNQIEFQEIQITETDDFGRINLLIGEAEHDYFKEISWDGTPKDLKVEIDFEAGSNFEEMSREALTFLPYAYHRNITATGTLTVDDKTFLNGEMEVQGPTNLFSTLTVHDTNPTLLTGTLDVDGDTNLNGALNVNNTSPTDLSGTLNVDGDASLNSDLDVLNGLTTLNDLTVNGLASFGDLTADNLIVNDSTHLKGGLNITTDTQVRIKRNFQDNFQLDSYMEHHVMLVEGGRQGMAIRVNGGRDNTTNFITFYDTTREESWGRIEGETIGEFENNDDWKFDQKQLDYDIYDASIDGLFAAADVYAAVTGTAMALSSSTGCAGVGACITAPIPSMIFKYTTESVVVTVQAITAAGGVIISLANKNEYDTNRENLQGVTYASGAGDYAEYLLRLDINELISYGDIVGVKGGKISKNTENAERVMVVSYKPIVLGNMPQVNRERDYEKVAFMGQVPVKVFGKVNIGDYIIPSGKNDGIGIAKSPNDITSSDIKNIVGIAWNSSEAHLGFNMINVAVGINNNDNAHIVQNLEEKVNSQQQELDLLKEQINSILEKLSRIENGENVQFTNINESQEDEHDHRKFEVVESQETDIVYFEITKTDIEQAIIEAEIVMRESGMYEANKEVWERMNSDPKFKADFIDGLLEKLQKQIHYHKQIDSGVKH